MLKNKTGAINFITLVLAMLVIINTIYVGMALGAVGDFTINLSIPPNAPTGSTISAAPGSIVKAAIAVELGPNVLGAYEFYLKYKGDVLRYSSAANVVKKPGVDPPETYGSFTAADQTSGQSGTLYLSWFQGDYMSTDNVLNGNLNLFEVTFTVQGTSGSSTDLTLEISALRDPDYSTIGTTQQLLGPVTVSVPAEIDTIIGSKPANPTNSVTAQFTFSATLTASKYECQLDSGSYVTCLSPQDYAGLSDGSHTFSVKAYNESGTPDSSPATYTWTIDLTPPSTSATPPAGTYNASQSVVLAANETATIYYTTDGTDPTINSSQYSGGINIGANTILKYFAKDTVGNSEAVKTAVYTIKITDTSVPTVTAFSIPATSNNLIVNITTFTATDNVGVTGYMVTESATAPASANTKWRSTVPSYYSFSVTGAKTLYAWARDAAGNVSASLSASVNVDTTPPTPQVGEFVIDLSNPPNTPVGSTISVASGSTVKAAMAVELGPNVLGAYELYLRYKGDVLKYVSATNVVKKPGVTPPETYGSFTAADQTSGQSGVLYLSWFQGDYMSIDNVLNGKLNLFEVTFTVLGTSGSSTDLTLEISALKDPDYATIGTNPRLIGTPVTVSVLGDINTIIDSQPANPSNSAAAQFTFSDSIPASKYECQIDSGDFVTCTSPQSYSGLSASSHTFAVRAYNMGGVPDDTPATYTWTIDLTPPTTTATPAAGSYSVSQSVTLSANESATIYYTTDGTDPTENSLQYAGAIDVTSTTTIKYFAKDAAGNSETIKTGLYTIDTTLPTVTAFNIPALANSLTVAITTFTATDSVGVTGYMATESATAPSPADGNWSSTSPANYTFDTAGAKTLYAWAKDAAGNVSASMSATTSVILILDFTISRCVYDVASGSVRLTWTNAGEQNFDVEYSDEPYSDTMAWTKFHGNITPEIGGITNYTDDGTETVVAPGDPTMAHRYYRVAVAGMEPAVYSKDSCGIFTTQVVEGMNLVSSPVIPESILLNAAIGNQLKGDTSPGLADRIWFWNRNTRQYEYAWLSTSSSHVSVNKAWRSTSGGWPESPMSLESDKGFWIQIRAGHGNKSLKLCGLIAASDRVSNIITGMQIFSSPYPVSVTMNDALNSINVAEHGSANPGTADRIWYWNRTTQQYEYAWLSTFAGKEGWRSTASGWPSAGFSLTPGQGYWFQVRDNHPGFSWTYSKPYDR